MIINLGAALLGFVILLAVIAGFVLIAYLIGKKVRYLKYLWMIILIIALVLILWRSVLLRMI